MLVKLLYQSWFVGAAHVLSEEILVISCWLSSEFIWSSLVVVCAEMVEHFWSHMSVIWAWSHSWEHH